MRHSDKAVMKLVCTDIDPPFNHVPRGYVLYSSHPSIGETYVDAYPTGSDWSTDPVGLAIKTKLLLEVPYDNRVN